jgi:SAM-dependent methyltransferase
MFSSFMVDIIRGAGEMKLTDCVHENFVAGRRARVLCSHLAELIPPDSRVLDVGCGDGLIAQLIMQMMPDLAFQGIDVLVRPGTRIPVESFDGQRLPYANASFDVVMFVDVLHHAEDPLELLKEAFRVSRNVVLIKDHTLEGFLAGPTLCFMDRVGNLRHGVALRYDYWSRQRWIEAFKLLGMKVTLWNQHLGLYIPPFNWIFERSLHFIARLDVARDE